jgi:hypothetical protein
MFTALTKYTEGLRIGASASQSHHCHSVLDTESIFLDSRLRGNDKVDAGMTGVDGSVLCLLMILAYPYFS